jgi:thiamine pyrophosphate-dependent acetolactate synthase large subunit-like protein
MMTTRQALEVLAGHRGDRVVISTMTSAGVWPELSDSPLDFAYLPSAMGQAPSLGLGVALARPGRGVIVLNGDGCTLMNLGCLVTLASHPADVFLVVLDNGLYEVTGGQKVAGAGRTDFAALARGAGVGRVYAFDDLGAWRAGAAEALAGPGPVVVWLRVEGRLGQQTPSARRPMPEQVRRFREALGAGE